MNNVEKTVNKLESSTDRAEVVMTEARLNIEMILSAQAEERKQIEERHAQEKLDIRKHYGKIIFGLALALFLLVGSALGGVIYVLMNYDIGVITQNASIGNNGDLNIYDGIHYDTN